MGWDRSIYECTYVLRTVVYLNGVQCKLCRVAIIIIVPIGTFVNSNIRGDVFISSSFLH